VGVSIPDVAITSKEIRKIEIRPQERGASVCTHTWHDHAARHSVTERANAPGTSLIIWQAAGLKEISPCVLIRPNGV
jgi:hypothetical protein